MHTPYQQEQLRFIVELAQLRMPALDTFFEFLNYFDSLYFSFLLLPVIWIGLSSRWGIRLFYLVILNFLINGVCKVYFGWPRPSTVLPEVGMYHFTSGGFPSGAAQTAFLLGGLLIYYSKNHAAWALGLCYIALISFSRMYLGVHFPTDILGGWLIGGVLLYTFVRSIDHIERYLHGRAPLFYFCISLIAIAPAAVISAGGNPFSHVTNVLVISFGILFSLKYHLYLPQAETTTEVVRRSLFALSFPLFLLFILPQVGLVGINFGWSLWVSLVASPFYRYLVRK